MSRRRRRRRKNFPGRRKLRRRIFSPVVFEPSSEAQNPDRFFPDFLDFYFRRNLVVSFFILFYFLHTLAHFDCNTSVN